MTNLKISLEAIKDKLQAAIAEAGPRGLIADSAHPETGQPHFRCLFEPHSEVFKVQLEKQIIDAGDEIIVFNLVGSSEMPVSLSVEDLGKHEGMFKKLFPKRRLDPSAMINDHVARRLALWTVKIHQKMEGIRALYEQAMLADLFTVAIEARDAFMEGQAHPVEWQNYLDDFAAGAAADTSKGTPGEPSFEGVPVAPFTKERFSRLYMSEIERHLPDSLEWEMIEALDDDRGERAALSISGYTSKLALLRSGKPVSDEDRLRVMEFESRMKRRQQYAGAVTPGKLPVFMQKAFLAALYNRKTGVVNEMRLHQLVEHAGRFDSTVLEAVKPGLYVRMLSAASVALQEARTGSTTYIPLLRVFFMTESVNMDDADLAATDGSFSMGRRIAMAFAAKVARQE